MDYLTKDFEKLLPHAQAQAACIVLRAVIATHPNKTELVKAIREQMAACGPDPDPVLASAIETVVKDLIHPGSVFGPGRNRPASEDLDEHARE